MLLSAKGLSKSFGGIRAVNNAYLEVPQGSITGLIGPNGAGKTTLIRILNQIIEPSSGQVLIGGIPINPLHVKSFGYLPEERGLYREMKVLDHLIFLASIRGLTHQDAQKAAGHWLEKFEIQPWSKKRIDSLSKGMAQKVQFIGSILHDPQVVILDEPLSGFDPLNIQLILNEIKAMKVAGKTIRYAQEKRWARSDLNPEMFAAFAIGIANAQTIIELDGAHPDREDWIEIATRSICLVLEIPEPKNAKRKSKVKRKPK